MQARLRRAGQRLGLFLVLSLAAPWAGWSAPDPAAAAREVDRLLIVDCMLPGQVRRLGTMLTYLSQRRPAKLSADECAIRGGEYVAYDRADLATALGAWLPQAQSGDPQAQTYVGELYERGIGGAAPDHAKAAEWYRKAADQGFARASINLGFLYEKGLGVPKDPLAALNLYRQASGVAGAIALDDGASSAARDEELRALRKELDDTRRQLDKAREQLQRRQGASRSELQRLEDERNRAQAAGNEAAARRFADQLRERERELETQRLEVARLERLLGDYRERLKGTESQTADLKRLLDDARAQLASTSHELEERRTRASEDQRRLATLRDELEQARAKTVAAADAAAERERIARLEQQLAQREEEAAKQAQEIVRLGQETKRYKAELAKLETQGSAPAPRTKDAAVAIAPPSIQLIDPPVMTMRGPRAIKVRGGLSNREIVGKVTAPAGLLSFTINDRSEKVDGNGLFKTQVQIAAAATAVQLVAVDRQGKRAAMEFTLVPEAAAATLVQQGEPATPALDFGNYHALVIGNTKYRHLPGLETAVDDANAVAEVLTSKYGFKATTLTNATRYEILSALNQLRGKLTEKDNLLIYYAGHGELDRANLRGHWLPIDAEPNSDANWISSVSITDIVNAMSVKHVLIVADSCYSGAMTRSSIGQLEPGLSDDARTSWLKALVQARARTVLTSGGVQPVMDGGGGRHSVFAKAFLEVLRDNHGALEAQRLYREVAARVVYLAGRYQVEQKPEYAPLKFAGHEAGDFIFVPQGS